MKRSPANIAPILVLAVFLSGCARHQPPPDKQHDKLAQSPLQTQAERKAVDYKNKMLRCESGEAIQKQIIALVNQARIRGRKCGSKNFAPSAGVRWSDRLAKIAQKHSFDMAAKNFVGHKGSNALEADGRLELAGYSYRSVGENIAAGQSSAAEAVRLWLQSPGHCANIMDPDFLQVGAACAQNQDSLYGTYWTLLFAAPKSP